MTPAEIYDLTGQRHGIPTYPWRLAPAGYATRRQLRALGLTPGTRQPAAQILWRRGKRVAYLFSVSAARSRRAATQRQQAALCRAYLAHCTCRHCGIVADYYLPRHWDGCPACNPEGTLYA